MCEYYCFIRESSPPHAGESVKLARTGPSTFSASFRDVVNSIVVVGSSRVTNVELMHDVGQQELESECTPMSDLITV